MLVTEQVVVAVGITGQEQVQGVVTERQVEALVLLLVVLQLVTLT